MTKKSKAFDVLETCLYDDKFYQISFKCFIDNAFRDESLVREWSSLCDKITKGYCVTEVQIDNASQNADQYAESPGHYLELYGAGLDAFQNESGR